MAEINLKFFSMNDTQEPTLLKEGECQQLVDCYLNKDGVLKARPILFKKNLNLPLYDDNWKIFYITFWQQHILVAVENTNKNFPPKLFYALFKENFDWQTQDWKEIPISVYNYFFQSQTSYLNELHIANLHCYHKVISFDGFNAVVRDFKIPNSPNDIRPAILLNAFNSLFLIKDFMEQNKIVWTLPLSYEITEDNWAYIGDEKPITYATFFQNKFLVFKEDKIYQVIGFERALMPDAIFPIANIGSPYGTVLNFKNQTLIFLANDGNIYAFEDNQLTNLSQKRIYFFLKDQYIPLPFEKRLQKNVRLKGTEEFKLGENNFRTDITATSTNLIYFEELPLWRNVETDNIEIPFGNPWETAKFTNTLRCAIVIKDIPSNIRLKEIIINILNISGQINNAGIYSEKNGIPYTEIKRADRIEILSNPSRIRFVFDFVNKWDGYLLLKKDETYFLVIEFSTPGITFMCSFPRRIKRDGRVLIWRNYQWVDWIEEDPASPNYLFPVVLDGKIIYVLYKTPGTLNFNLKCLDEPPKFYRWIKIHFDADNEVELYFTFIHPNISQITREYKINTPTSFYFYLPSYYKEIRCEIILNAWGENYEYPSHLWGISFQIDDTIPLNFGKIPKGTIGKEASYLAFICNNYQTQKDLITYPKTILRIDEFKNLSLFNLYEDNDDDAEIPILTSKEDWIFIANNYSRNNIWNKSVIIFNENHKKDIEWINQDKIPHNIYILTSAFPSANWILIKKLFAKLFIDFWGEDNQVYLSLLPYRRETDLYNKQQTKYYRFGQWINNKLQKLAYYYKISPTNISQQFPYSYEALQKSKYKVFQCFSDIVLKDFVVAIRTTNPSFEMFPIISIDYEPFRTILTGVSDVDNIQTEKPRL